MRSIHELVSELRRANVRVWSDGDQLRYRAPSGALTLDLKTEMRQRRDELLEFCRQARPEPQSPPLRPISRNGPLAISLAQQRLWLLQQIEGPSPTYNVTQALQLKGRLDLDALERSLGTILGRHEALRTTFTLVDDEVRQCIAPYDSFELSVIDLRDRPPDARLAEVRRQAYGESFRAFDLDKGPLVRFVIWKVDDERHVLLVNLHHIISDGRSIGILTHELAILYEAFCGGRQLNLPELSVQCADYAAWQRAALREELLTKELEYWRRQLDGLPPLLELPTDRPRPSVQTWQGAFHRLHIDASLLAALKKTAVETGSTLYTSLLTALAVILSRYTGRTDIPIGCHVSYRDRPEIERLIGFFINTLVLRVNLSGDPTLRELLARTRDVLLDGMAHQNVPFEKLVESLVTGRSTSYSPLVQVTAMLLDGAELRLALPGLEIEPFELERPVARFDLDLEMYEQRDGIDVIWIYNTDLFDESTIARMANYFGALLEEIASDPSRRLSELSALTARDRRLLSEWNDTASDYPRDHCIHQLLEEQARRTPEAVAVVFEGRPLTYAQLNARANQVAHYLRQLGVGPEVLVGICVERSLDMVVGVLGILKAGGAYVPLDPDYPSVRLAFMLEDTQAPVLLTQQALLPRLAANNAHVVCLDADWKQVDPQPDANLPAQANGENLAYVIYTSGSTGMPKGVMISHGSLADHCIHMIERYDLVQEDCVLQFASLSFDQSVEQIFTTFLAGASLVLRSKELWPAEGFWDIIRSLSLSVVDLPPAFFELWIRAAGGPPELESIRLRLVIVGGDVLSRESLQLWQESVDGSIPLLNAYGPTEATITSTLYEVLTNQERRLGWRVPIGRPLKNVQTYILGADQRPVPIGVAGELYIGGAGLARGYLNRPELTAEKFIPNPFSPVPGSRLYRTGDLCRWLSHGNLEFLGRLDHQVKIRGYRIEPGEIESALRAHGQVREAVVLAREDEPGEKRLVAYVVPAGADQTPVSAAVLREHLSAGLPAYMMPSAFVFLEALPLTPNGKVDRRSLPAPDGPLELEGQYVPPRNPVEEQLCAIWQEVLRLERVGVQDNFFELGGHSLLATQVISRVRGAFQVGVPVAALFTGPTVAELAVALQQQWSAGAAVGVPALVSQDREEEVPLSFAQQRLWFLDQLLPESPQYNMPGALRLRGRLDRTALERAWQQLVQRHEALRTRFESRGGQPRQVIEADWGQPLLAYEDLRPLSEAEREAEARRRAQHEATRPFDLSRGPLLRVLLWQLGDEEHVLLVNMHHIVSDGWSIGVLVRELSLLYSAFCVGQADPLPPLSVQYADYAIWQRSWLCGGVLEGHLRYWREQLAGVEVLELPTDHPRPAVSAGRGASVEVQLPRSLNASLKELCLQQEVSLFMLLLSAWQVSLSRWTGQADVVVGSPIANRTQRHTEGLIGFFVNTLALRSDLSGDPRFSDLLRQVRERTLAAYAHQDLPFEQLVDALELERDLSRESLVQVMFAWQNAPAAELDLDELSWESLPLEQTISKFDLTLSLGESAEGLSGALEYRSDLFERETIERMVGHLRRLLEGIVSAPGSRLSQLPMLTDEERQQLLVEWNDTATDYPQDQCIHQLFEEQARRTPEALAVVFENRQLTYAQLNARANQLAHHLRHLEVGPEVLVGLCVERSLEMVVGLLGILKAGGAYVPLDPDYPVERLAFMLTDTQAPVLLTLQALRDRLPASKAQVVCLDTDWQKIDQQPGANLPAQANADNLAYVIYTSGSTGRPKGCSILHRSVVRLVTKPSYAEIGPAEVILQFAPISFDASTFEIWAPLVNGARLVVFPPYTPSFEDLGTFIADHEVTTLWLTSALFSPMVDGQIERLGGVGQLLAGGDVLSVPHVCRMMETLRDRRLINGYGPTENTTFTCCHVITAGSEIDHSVPIGRPVNDTQVYLLDHALMPVPVGVAGELYIGGAGLARGYLNRPELTAEKFIPNPFSPAPGSRLYRTGDLCRWLSHGNLEFLGRLDHQVKIRGYRIEPGEIESALRAHGQVREAVVLAREDEPGEKRLVAYVVPSGADQTPVSAAVLREHLSAGLPAYMMPSAFVFLEALPLTPNGKVDRRSLPAPDGPLELEGQYVPPRNPVEEQLCAIWQEVLRLERVGVQDDFFELGGHSLLATQVMSRVRESFCIEVPLRELFQSPTVAGLAERVDAAKHASSQATAIRPVSTAGPPRLSFAQERLWFLDQLEPGNPFYNVPIALTLKGQLNVAALAGAIGEIVRRHAVLRSSYPAVDGKPTQVIANRLEIRLPVVDLNELPGEARTSEATRRVVDEMRLPFDLAKGPLIRAQLLRLDRDNHILLFTMHHIVSDGWSLGVLIEELVPLYRAGLRATCVADEAAPDSLRGVLPDLPIQYGDFAAWQREWLSGEVLERQLAYWRRQLACVPPVLGLPTDRPRPPAQSYRGSSVRFTVDPATTAALWNLSQDKEATLFMTLLGGWAALLYRYSGQNDIVIGSPIANRNRREIEPLIGFFVNTLALRVDLSGNPAFNELVKRVRQVALDAYTHQDLPFERLVDEIQPERDLSLNPLFQVMFTLQNMPAKGLDLPGLTVDFFETKGISALFDLVLDMWEVGDSLVGMLEYNTDLFDGATIERLVESFQTLLHALALEPAGRVDEIPLLSDAQQRRMLEIGRGPRIAYPVEQTIQQLFEEATERHANRVALVHNARHVTYAELNVRANQIAHGLRQRRVGRGQFVGILLDRGSDCLAAMLGILKAGGAFLPIDPAYPADRIRYMLADSGIRTLVSRAETFAACVDRADPAAPDLCLLDLASDSLPTLPPTNPAPVNSPHDVAYLLYTSGSTGVPKGAMVRHNGAVNHTFAEFELLSFHPDSAFLQSAPSSSDISVWQFLAPVLIGGRTVVADYETVCDPSRLFQTLRSQSVTLIELVPVVMNELLDYVHRLAADERELPDLQWAMITGEAAPVSVVNRWLETYPGIRLINAYGPTEAADDICQHVIDRPLLAGLHNVPIGRPLANLALYVLDRNLRLVHAGVPGEICVAGIGVGPGYWNNEAKTRESFVANPYSSHGDDRVLYRTGDLGRWLPDGTLECLDRLDRQVKVRGFRIELGEIEGVLHLHPAVREAAVIVREDLPGDKRLTVYVAPNPASEPVQRHLRELKHQQVSLWQDLHEDSYRDTLDYADPTFNVIGWDSNYTNQPLPREDMHEYVDFTVERIRRLQPHRLLEIGCGTGLIMFPLLPHLDVYAGTDLSQVAIHRLQELQQSTDLQRQIPGLAAARLVARRADDFAWIESGSFDTAVLPSVVQYFPDIDYLLQVLEGLVRHALVPGGAIFLGDVRSLPLLEAFHASVQLFKAGKDLAVTELADRIRNQLAREQELAVDPEFFTALTGHFSEIAHVEVLPKRGRRQNEMTRFRYDVLIRLHGDPLSLDGGPRTPNATASGSHAASPGSIEWIDWRCQRPSAAELYRRLAENRPGAVALCRVANRRVQEAHQTAAWLADGSAVGTVGQLEEALGRHEFDGIEPEQLWELADQMPYDVHVALDRRERDGSLKVAFTRRGADVSPSGLGDPTGSAEAEGCEPKSWSAYANNPLREKLARKLAPELREFLRSKMPNYMVPSDVVILDALPLTPAGKIDRKSLPAPETAAQAEDYVAPRTAQEEAMCRIWVDVLGVPRVGVRDNFFQLGGHSLKATQVASRIHRDFGVELPVRDMFNHPTIAELIALIATREAQVRVAIQRVPDADHYPLSHAQRGIWVASQMDGGSIAHNMTEALLIEGQLDPDAVAEALDRLMQRHESLRTTFILVDGEPRQRVHARMPFRLEVSDLSTVEQPERRARELADINAAEPFALEDGPLLRAALLKLSANRFAFLFAMHHIISDDWSMGVLVREFVRIVEALRRGTPCDLPELRFHYRDYSARQLRLLRDGSLDREREYWHRKLGGHIPVLCLPTDYPRSAVRTFRGAEWSCDLDPDLTRVVQAFCRREQVSLFMLLVASIKSLLYRYTGQGDIVIGCPIAARGDVDLENQVGLYLNTLAIRDQVSGDRPFQDLLRQVRQSATEAYEHQGYPFDRLVSDLQLKRQGDHSPLFDVMVILQNVDPYELTFAGAQIRVLEQRNRSVQFDLCFYCQEIGDRLSFNLRYRSDLFESATISHLSARLRALMASVVRAPATLLDDLPLDLPAPQACAAPDPVEFASDLPAVLPLSYHQERLWFIDRFETANVYEANPTYHNMPYLMHFRGELDRDALQWSLSQLAGRHHALRTCFAADAGVPRQIVLPEAVFKLEVLSQELSLEEAVKSALAHSSRPFRLHDEAPVRAALVPMGRDEALFVLTAHHIVADRESLRIVGCELAEIYASRKSHRPAPLPPPNAQYGDYTQWQRTRGHEVWEPLLFHWRWRLRGELQALELPEDRPRPAVHTYTAGCHRFVLDADLMQRLKVGGDRFHVLLAGFSILLHRYARQDEIVVGTSMPCRGPRQANLVGPVDNLTVLRSFLGGNPTCRSVLSQIEQTVRAARQYRHLPFDLLVSKLNPAKDMSRTALFDVLFQYEPKPPTELSLDGVRGRVLDTNLGQGKYDLNLLVQQDEAATSGTLVYNADIYDAATIERIAGHYGRLLELMAREAESRIDDLQFLDEGELHRQLVTWNSTAAAYPGSLTIHALFEEHVRKHAARTALVCGDTRLTYDQLNRRANQLGHALRQRGVATDTLVAVCLDRSADLVVALLAILKAGGAYLPVEPYLPASRLEFILRDAEVAHMVTSQEHAAHLPDGRWCPILIDDAAVCEGMPETDPQFSASPTDLAYCIYTSGSTGKPKGVLVEHRNVVRLLVNDKLPFTFTPDDAWTMFHSHSFDFSVWEMYGALLYGGKLVMVPPELTNDPARYLDLLASEAVTVLNQTPSAFYLLAQEACTGIRRDLALRYVIFGGEALQPVQLRTWFDTYSGVHLVNMYGITETTVHVTWKEITRADIDGNTRSVGVPIPTTTLYVMDANLRLLPVGVPGEICVGGLGVSRGYLRRDELTRTKFVANPYRPEERIYRSGDLARFLPNGEIAYLGRIDDQVQIRGFRVELGEVESVLLHHPAVREAVVMAFPEDQSMRLVAYCVPQPGSENERFPTAAELREFLKSELPDYMVPATFLQLDCFPLTLNGKVDRRALPSADRRQLDTDACYVAPRNDSERVLAGIWQQALKLERVGAHDNFFDLGGDSLLLIRVKNQIREELAVDLPVVELFRYPTVDSLSRFLSENQTRGAELEQSEQRAQQRKAALQRRGNQRQKGARE